MLTIVLAGSTGAAHALRTEAGTPVVEDVTVQPETSETPVPTPLEVPAAPADAPIAETPPGTQPATESPETTPEPTTPSPTIALPAGSVSGDQQDDRAIDAPADPEPAQATEPSGTPTTSAQVVDVDELPDVSVPRVRIDSVRFTAVDPAESSPGTTGTVVLSCTDVPADGPWKIMLGFDDFISDSTGAMVPAAGLTLVRISESAQVFVSQDRGVFMLEFPEGSGLAPGGSISITVRLAIPDPATDSTYRSSVTATISPLPENPN